MSRRKSLGAKDMAQPAKPVVASSEPSKYNQTQPPSWIMQVIPADKLTVLNSYKYQGTDLSLLVELFLRRFWNWCIEFYPLWIAPNMITTLGFIFLASSYFVALSYCPAAVGCVDVPRWIFVFAAFNLFIYQLMDNLDGKQARRTGTSSPLGELFDHGCDSLFLPLTSIPLSLALGFDVWEAMQMHIFSLSMFYAAHWEEYHSKHLVLARLANPTEAQVMIMGLFLASSVLGPTWFRTTTVGSLLPFLSLPAFLSQLSMTKLLMYFSNFGCTFSILDCSRKLITWTRKHNDSYVVVFSRMLPFVFLFGFLYTWILHSQINILVSHTVLVWATTGLISSYLTIHIMICRITDMDFSFWHNILLIPLIAALNLIVSDTPIVNEVTLLYALFAFTAVYYWYYVVSITLQLAHYLGIKVFTI